MMLRALVRAKNGRTVLILGLNRDIVAQLQAGSTVVVDGTASDLPLSINVIFLYGATIEDIVADLRSAGITLPGDA